MPSNFGQPLKQNHLYDEVVNRIREMILSGKIATGAKLPGERELADQLGVSRVVIRDATRILNAQGLLEIRPGSGTYVRTVGTDQVVDSIGLFLRMNQNATELDKLLEVRFALETDIAGLAAQRAAAYDIKLLEQNVQAMKQTGDDITAFTRLDYEFHQLLASATRNELFSMLLEPLSGLLLEFRERTYIHDSEEATQGALIYHNRILDLIKQKDSAGAREAMRNHLRQAEEVYSRLRDSWSP